MKYDEAVSYLENCHKFGSKQGHKNFKKLMALLGDPHKDFKVIHIAGTNGKGSTCSMIYSILSEQGYRVGLFTSPHLQKYNERITACGENISDYDFTRHIQIVKEKVFELFENTEEFFSFFEIITAAAFSYFCEKNLDFVVLEVGLGGRLDSTNIIENPLVSVITSISFDHTEYLGETISEIAKEKGGIIKKNSYTVLYFGHKKVYNIIKEICTEKNSELLYTENYGINIISQDLNGTVFNVKNKYFSYEKISIGFCGEYQVFNACNALMTVEALRKQGVFISEKAVLKGLRKARIRGRMDIIMREPLFILDGAHNVGGIEYLSLFLEKVKNNNKKITIIIGILKDKDYAEMIYKITRFCDNVIFTEADNKRAVRAENLFEIGAFENKKVFIEDDFRNAVNTALKNSDNSDCIVCTGSLYLVGDVLKYIYSKSIKSEQFNFKKLDT